MSLTKLYHDHVQQQNEEKKETQRLKAQASAASRHATDCIVAGLNSEVSDVFDAQRQIEAEVKQLQAQLARHTKAASQWMGMVGKFNQALKQLGDVENWAEKLETDMRYVVAALEEMKK